MTICNILGKYGRCGGVGCCVMSAGVIGSRFPLNVDVYLRNEKASNPGNVIVFVTPMKTSKSHLFVSLLSIRH
jgi:hypothetical protein